MLKKASMYLWGLVIAYIGLFILFDGMGMILGRIMADNFGTIFFGAIGIQILMSIIIPFLGKK